MKRGTPDHPKTFRLAALLGCEHASAVGYLEMLWQRTAEYAPQGNIGKIPDEFIAKRCYWTGDPAVFMRAMCESGWIEASQRHRYLIHDWHDHATDSVRKHLDRNGLQFLTDRTQSGRHPTQSGRRQPTGTTAGTTAVTGTITTAGTTAARSRRRSSTDSGAATAAPLRDAVDRLATLSARPSVDVLREYSRTQRGKEIDSLDSIDRVSESWRKATLSRVTTAIEAWKTEHPEPTDAEREHEAAIDETRAFYEKHGSPQDLARECADYVLVNVGVDPEHPVDPSAAMAAWLDHKRAPFHVRIDITQRARSLLKRAPPP